MCVYQNPPPWIGYNTRSVFKRNTAVLRWSFLRPVATLWLKSLVCPTIICFFFFNFTLWATGTAKFTNRQGNFLFFCWLPLFYWLFLFILSLLLLCKFQLLFSLFYNPFPCLYSIPLVRQGNNYIHLMYLCFCCLFLDHTQCSHYYWHHGSFKVQHFLNFCS